MSSFVCHYRTIFLMYIHVLKLILKPILQKSTEAVPINKFPSCVTLPGEICTRVYQ